MFNLSSAINMDSLVFHKITFINVVQYIVRNYFMEYMSYSIHLCKCIVTAYSKGNAMKIQAVWYTAS